MPSPFRGLYDATRRRSQRVYTPRPLVTFVRRVLGSIELDPCSGPDSLVGAVRAIEPPDDGLSIEWVGNTYVNPPFNKLRKWLDRARSQRGPTIALAPVRTHRRWFRAAMADGLVRWLDPVTFVGHTSAFPAPLCLMLFGDYSRSMAQRFRRLHVSRETRLLVRLAPVGLA